MCSQTWDGLGFFLVSYRSPKFRRPFPFGSSQGHAAPLETEDSDRTGSDALSGCGCEQGVQVLSDLVVLQELMAVAEVGWFLHRGCSEVFLWVFG